MAKRKQKATTPAPSISANTKIQYGGEGTFEPFPGASKSSPSSRTQQGPQFRSLNEDIPTVLRVGGRARPQSDSLRHSASWSDFGVTPSFGSHVSTASGQRVDELGRPIPFTPTSVRARSFFFSFTTPTHFLRK